MSDTATLIKAGFDPDAPEFSALLGWSETAPQQIEGGIEDALFEALRATLSRTVTQEVLAEARTFASRKASELAVGITNVELRKIGQTISDGLEAGKGPFEVARDLDAVKGLDPVRARKHIKFRDHLDTLDITAKQREQRETAFFNHQLRERKKTIARTEGNFAVSEAAHLRAKARGDNWKVWITNRDDRVSRKICARNEAAGWIRINEEFPAGQVRTPGHPNCRCAIAYREEAPGEEEIRRAKLASLKTARELGIPDFDLSLPGIAA